MNPQSTPCPATAANLEKIPAAAKRMCISVPQIYRLLKSGDLAGGIVKLGERSSAVRSDCVDAWIAARIAAAQSRSGGAKGGAA